MNGPFLRQSLFSNATSGQGIRSDASRASSARGPGVAGNTPRPSGRHGEQPPRNRHIYGPEDSDYFSGQLHGISPQADQRSDPAHPRRSHANSGTLPEQATVDVVERFYKTSTTSEAVSPANQVSRHALARAAASQVDVQAIKRSSSPEESKPRMFAMTKPSKSLRERLNAGKTFDIIAGVISPP